MNFNIQEINKYIVASDTDSMFICFEPILKKLYPNIDIDNKKEILPLAKKLQSEIRPILNEYQTIIAKNILNSDEHFFDLKPEFILQSAYWSGKRRYAQLLVDKEGREIEKTVIMGLDITKSNFPKYFQGFGLKLIEKVLYGVDKKEIDEFILEFRNSINNVKWKELSKPTGLKKMGEYIDSPPPIGKIFSQLGKKCPINTKSAIRTTDLMKFYGWDKTHPTPQIGDKIFIIYLKKNQYRIDSVSTNGWNDHPDLIEFINEFIDKDKMFESIIQKKIDRVYADLNFGRAVYNSIISEFFSF